MPNAIFIKQELLSFIKQSTSNIKSFMITYCLLHENSTKFRNTLLYRRYCGAFHAVLYDLRYKREQTSTSTRYSFA